MTVPADPTPSYHTPAGPRDKWTKAEYEQYKKEKDAYIANERRKRETKSRFVGGRFVTGKPTLPKPKMICYNGYPTGDQSIVPGVKAVPKEPAASQDEGAEWVVPDIREEDQLEAEPPVVRYVNAEHEALKDFWPSATRTKIAEDVDKDWIKKSVSLVGPCKW